MNKDELKERTKLWINKIINMNNKRRMEFHIKELIKLNAGEEKRKGNDYTIDNSI